MLANLQSLKNYGIEGRLCLFIKGQYKKYSYFCYVGFFLFYSYNVVADIFYDCSVKDL